MQENSFVNCIVKHFADIQRGGKYLFRPAVLINQSAAKRRNFLVRIALKKDNVIVRPAVNVTTNSRRFGFALSLDVKSALTGAP